MNILFKTLLILFSILFSVTTVHADTKIVYVVSDYRGDAIYQMNNTGGIVRDSAYNPYGEDSSFPALQGGSDVGFAGLIKDADMKLVYAGARYYDAEIHRFIEPDPEDALDHIADNTILFNRYAYANNNPYKYIDPDGRLPFLIPLAIFIAKEIAAEGLSQATGGASDFLSVRKMGTKAGKFAVNKLSAAVQTANKEIASKGVENVTKKADGYVDLASPQRRKHILDGDATGGGHRPGIGKPGKSEFPQGWSDDRIMHNISDVATDPNSVTRAGRGGRTITEGTRDGINIRVIQERNGDIVSGFPTNMPRNP